MMEEAARFQELQAQKDEERRNFEKCLEKLRNDHEGFVLDEMEQHRKEMDVKNT